MWFFRDCGLIGVCQPRAWKVAGGCNCAAVRWLSCSMLFLNHPFPDKRHEARCRKHVALNVGMAFRGCLCTLPDAVHAGVGSSGAAWLQLKFGDGKGQHEMVRQEPKAGSHPCLRAFGRNFGLATLVFPDTYENRNQLLKYAQFTIALVMIMMMVLLFRAICVMQDSPVKFLWAKQASVCFCVQSQLHR